MFRVITVKERPIYFPIVHWYDDIGVDAKAYFVERRDGMVWPIKIMWYPEGVARMKVESWQATDESRKRIAEAIKRADSRVVWVRYFEGVWMRT